MIRELSPIIWITLSIAGYAVVLLTTWLYLKARRRQRLERDSTFITTLRNGVLNGSIRALKDVEAFYSAFYDSPQLAFRDSEAIALALRKLLMTPSHPSTPESTNTIEHLLPTARDLISEHDRAMQEARKELPFAGTPSPERELLQDIVALSGHDQGLIETKLTELGKA